VKHGASPCEASCEAQAQPHLSCEDKGKAPLNVDSVAYAASTRATQSPLSCEAKLEARGSVICKASLALPNQGAPVSSAKFAPLSEVKGVPPSLDRIAYDVSAPKGANKVFGHKASTKALYSAGYLHCNMKIKAPLCAKSKATIISLSALSSTKLAPGGEANNLASSSEANAKSEVVLTSLEVKKRNLKDRVLQLEQPSTQPLRVSILNRLSSVSPDL